MIRLKSASTAKASLPSMPSTEITNGENFMLIVEFLTVLILISFIPHIQERCHWLKPVGIRISFANFDVDCGIGMSVP